MIAGNKCRVDSDNGQSRILITLKWMDHLAQTERRRPILKLLPSTFLLLPFQTHHWARGRRMLRLLSGNVLYNRIPSILRPGSLPIVFTLSDQKGNLVRASLLCLA